MDVSEARKLITQMLDNVEQELRDKDGWEIGIMVSIVQTAGPNGELATRVSNTAPAPFMALGLMRVAEEIVLEAR
jgi:hypothetical protein